MNKTFMNSGLDQHVNTMNFIFWLWGSVAMYKVLFQQ